MPLSILVTNNPPQTESDVPGALLKLFQQCINGSGDTSVVPFRHQAEVFRLIMNNQQVFLVAGTAAGKTLAIAVPLFQKLREGTLRKVLLMYPTVALLEDQRRVMDRLAQMTGLEIGQIQGGLSRTELMASLNKPVILATPDEVYWFFRKNIKYSGLLIYGLALVDEFVLDEAHLFNGLMLRNFEHLWRRIKSLAAILGKTPRLHILTATPTEALRRLNNGIRVTGRSKCQSVSVEFRPCGRFDRAEAIEKAIQESVSAGQGKVLVVCNSAKMTHQLFEKHKAAVGDVIPAEYRLRFGKVQLGNLLQWLEQVGTYLDMDDLSARFFHEEEITLGDLPSGTMVDVLLPDLIAGVTDVLERQCWRVKRVLWQQKQQLGETWESLLHNHRLSCSIIAAVRSRLQAETELGRQQAFIDEWLTDTLRELERVPDEVITSKAPDFAELQQALSDVLGGELASLVVKRLVHEIKIDPKQTSLPLRRLGHQPVYLRRLDRMVPPQQVDDVWLALLNGLESGTLKVDCRHIGLWKGTDVPVIVYSGSMAKHARAGLIDAFAGLEPAVLISTSAVEVGVDFAADTLITEECEGNSFLQRFGRVGRHGSGSCVVVLVSGDVAVQWQNLNGQRLSREDFSQKILETFPTRSYASTSPLLDAGHYLVNEQLGRIGRRLNQAPNLTTAKPLADQLRAAEIPVGFGLRSTIPQITIKDGVSKDPFYLLHYMDDQDLLPASSPFEVARAKKWFTELIFQPARFKVMMDLETTLWASRVWFWIAKRMWQLKAQPGIGLTYAYRFSEHLGKQGDWHPWHLGNFLLLHGDMYLQRVEKDVAYPKPEPVCDDEQNPLFIPAQNYLIFLGWDDVDKAREWIEDSPIAEWEELHYDWEGVEFNKSLVLLERATGACFAAYKEWMEYVGQRFQK